MTLDQAKKTIMPFGKCRGWTLEKVADDDPLYIDWLRGIELRRDLAEALFFSPSCLDPSQPSLFGTP